MKVDVRILAATNRDLAADVASGRFREDLYYGLNVVGVEMPPLRLRGGEVLALAEHFLRRFAEENHIDAVDGSTVRAAELLDISVRTIQYRLHEYGVAKDRGRGSEKSGAG